MAVLVFDPAVEDRLKAEREASGADRYDEVWEGVYMMAPLGDIEHQQLQTRLGTVFDIAVRWAGLGDVFTGVNVSDRERGWQHNYRIPDVAVVLKRSRARDCGTHLCGGPDFAVEIVSSGDRSRDKLDFYAGVGVRELLLIDRDPWAIDLWRLGTGKLSHAARCALGDATPVTSNVIPLAFRILPETPRPQSEVTHQDGVQRWVL